MNLLNSKSIRQYTVICLVVAIILVSINLAIPFDGVMARGVSQPTTQIKGLIKREYEFDLTKVLVQEKGKDRPEIIVIEDVPRESGFISSKKLEEKGIEKIVNQVRYNRLEKKLIELSQQSNIEYVQPVYIYNTAEWSRSGDKDTPNDFGQDPSALEGNHWYYEQSRLREMWKDQDCLNNGVSCGGSADVIVAVIDTGLAFEDHTSAWADIGNDPFVFSKLPDMFSGDGINLWTNTGEIPNNNIDDDNNGVVDDYHGFHADNQVYCRDIWDGCDNVLFAESGHPNDDIGHGTTVTGLIASLVDNSSGSVSPAHKVTIMPIKANTQKADSFDTITLIESINYAVTNGADVINLSLAGSSHDPAFETAINNAHNAGVLVVAASGNGGGFVLYPARYNNVIAVGSVNADNTRSYYSSYGPELDLVAYVGDGGIKGDAVYQGTYTCASTDPNCFDPDNTNTLRYTQFSNSYAIGTSFASPQVAAAVAIIKSNNPGIKKEELAFALSVATNDIVSYGVGSDNKTGTGVIDFQKAGKFLLSDIENVAYLTAYRDTPPQYRAWIIAGNPSTIDTLNVSVAHYGNAGGVQTQSIPPNGRYSFSFPGASDGPIKIIGNNPFYSTIKSEVNGGPDETAGFSGNHLSSKYYFPAYRHSLPKYSAWIIVGNPNDSSVEVEVVHSGPGGGTKIANIPANGRYTFKFEGATEGPVKVRATDNTSLIYTTIKSEVNGFPDETEGIPFDSLDSEYYFPAYRYSLPKYSAWIIVGNPNDLSVEVEVVHSGPGGGTKIANIPANGRYTFKFEGATEGPVKVRATDNTSLIYTTIKSEVDGAPDETPGIALSSMDTQYFFPAYRSQTPVYSAWIIVGNPNNNSTNVTVQHLGQGGGSQTQTIPVGGRYSFKFEGATGGPVIVTSSVGNIYTTIKSEVNNMPDETAGISATYIGL